MTIHPDDPLFQVIPSIGSILQDVYFWVDCMERVIERQAVRINQLRIQKTLERLILSKSK